MILRMTALLLIWAASTLHAQPIPAPLDLGASNGMVALRNVHVLSMSDNQIRTAQTVVMHEGVILWVGDLRHDASAVSGAGTVLNFDEPVWVMPGLAEIHAHIPPTPSSLNTEEDIARLHWRDQTLAMYLINGVTTVRGMLGEPAHLELREQARAQQIVAPQIYTSGPSFNGNSVRNATRGIEMVREQHAAGYDLLKFHPGLTMETFEAVTREARSVGIEFSGHISHGVGLEVSLRSGKTTIDHLDRYMEFLSGDAAARPDPSIIYFGYDLAYKADENLIPDAVRMTIDAGVWNVPTNTLLENVFNPDLTLDVMAAYPGMDYVPENIVSGWTNFITILRNQHDYDPDQARRFLELRATLTRALHEGGARLLLGSDAPQIFNPPGFSLHRELALLVDYGLSPFDALATGTRYVGDYLAEMGHTGTEPLEITPDSFTTRARQQAPTGRVEAGFRADLIVLDRNPLTSIPFQEGIIGVASNGLYYDTEALRTLYDSLSRP